MDKRKLILRNFLSPGDLVLLTAAVRELHRSHPGQFVTDVRSSCPELWEHNPYLTPLREDEEGVELIDCQYPLIHQSNDAPYHCIHGFSHFLGTFLGLDLRPAQFRGDIHLSPEERRWKSVVHELSGADLPFWIVNAGGKFDFTIKWWDERRYQQVIDHFRGRILFVQVGELGHYHPPLRGVIDLRGKTDLRQLVRLVYHAHGVLCGVTALMHLAAAVPTRPDRPPARAAVVVAGGREPAHWEAYPHHQFIHTIGALPCCATGGCWHARTRAIGDGEDSDRPEKLCRNVSGDLPRCMDMITADEVIRRIELYQQGGCGSYLTAAQRTSARKAVARSRVGPRFESTINLATAPGRLARAAQNARQARPPPMQGQGIVVVAHGENEMAAGLECVRTIRALGCNLPVECWVQGRCGPAMTKQFRKLDADVNRAWNRPRSATDSMTRADLWLHALGKTGLRHVLVLDAELFPVASPDAFFRSRDFIRSGVVLPRSHRCRARPGVWNLCGLCMPGHTAGDAVMVIDRERCWGPLQLWRWIMDRMYFFSGYVDGTGGAAQLAFNLMSRPPVLSLKLSHAFLSAPNDDPRATSLRAQPVASFHHAR